MTLFMCAERGWAFLCSRAALIFIMQSECLKPFQRCSRGLSWNEIWLSAWRLFESHDWMSNHFAANPSQRCGSHNCVTENSLHKNLNKRFQLGLPTLRLAFRRLLSFMIERSSQHKSWLITKRSGGGIRSQTWSFSGDYSNYEKVIEIQWPHLLTRHKFSSQQWKGFFNSNISLSSLPSFMGCGREITENFRFHYKCNFSMRTTGNSLLRWPS